MGSISKVKRSLIFIPYLYYSSHPLFFSIVDRFSGYETVYINTNEPGLLRFNQSHIIKEYILNHFDTYYELSEMRTTDFNSGSKVGVRLRFLLHLLRILLKEKQYSDNLESILQNVRPCAIITTADMSYSARIIQRWAGRNNVPVIIIQPAFINFDAIYQIPRHPIWSIVLRKLIGAPPSIKQNLFGNEDSKNYLFLFGSYFKQYYEGKAIYDNIYITGNPVFDKYFGRHNRGNNQLRQIMDIPFGEKVVTICTQPQEVMGATTFGELLTLYRGLIADNKDLLFVIKVHPREDTEIYNKALEQMRGSNFRVVKDIDLQELYEITDVQVSISSYSSFEAVVMGIPIVLVNPDNQIKLFEYFHSEIALTASTKEELSRHIRRCLTVEYTEEFIQLRSRYLESMLDRLDGKSADRVVRAVEEIVSKKRVKG